ncbi:hypothetical protein IGB42_00805 [Andreprevotia sp. IGB-42]|uniref:antitoxin Xre/MbcA/ParS toxin-binding domain-containing protein n=1 Tax=Andreprevotia sp. IGB-42 TaxID=2497473 RepID=UPI00135AC9E6|nr:antitoxin Xre/MbcA/ParS toxin-binding domain-containing protein [Andreprevotia sp. IGB-42]KAF0814750.1 hypothetical protein IGB42_00805 [Andreprevotia sp. IGB-42]
MPQRVHLWRIAQELDAQLGDLPDLRAELLMIVDHEPHRLLPWLGVIEQAESVLGDLHRAVTWFKSPTPALNGEIPAVLLHDPDGPERARLILTKMQQKSAN